MNIPTGYQVRISTWENDGDYRKTQVINGLSKEDVYFYQDLTKLFYSRHRSEMKGFGNGSVDAEELIQRVTEILGAHPNISRATHDLWNDPEFPDSIDIIYDTLCECVLGYPEEYDKPYFCRVFEKFEVLFFKE